MHRPVNERVPLAKLPFSLGFVTSLALICDSAHRVLPAREAHPRSDFVLKLQCIGMID